MDKDLKALQGATEIRNRSQGGRLMSREELLEFLELEEDTEDVLAQLQAPNDLIDLGVVTDKHENEWYYSRTEMLPAYAQTLLRVQDEDLLNLIADTVRNESKIYPRATRVDLFSGPPFRLSEDALTLVLTQLGTEEETADIQRTRASNGTEFLFSTRHLTPFYAGKLAEWEEVGSKEIP